MSSWEFFVVTHEEGRHELACPPPVDVSRGHRGAGTEVLGNVLKAEVLLDVLLPLFFLPPRSGVAFLRPERRRRLCGGVPAGVGGFGILSPQIVNVGWGGGRGQLRGHGLVGL
jgi:hypothetical protein